MPVPCLTGVTYIMLTLYLCIQFLDAAYIMHSLMLMSILSFIDCFV